MLFYVTTEDDIGASDEQRRTETNAGRSSFASEQELQELAGAWPMKRLVEIWNRLPGIEPVARFTDRKIALRRIWRALQPQSEKGGKPARRASQSRPRPVFREGSKAAQVCTLLSRQEGATMNEIRSQTGGCTGGISLLAAPRASENCARDHRTDVPAERIRCVFLCIFLLLQREMRC
jgi:hypothetical protein